MNNAKKSEEKKAVAQKTATPAENKNAVKETAAVVKTEAKTSAAAKSTAKKTTAPKTEKAAVKKADAKTTRAAKSDAKAAKPAAKSASKTAKAAGNTAAKKSAPAKKSAKKSNAVTINTICTKLEKKISNTKAAAIKEKVAVDIEVWGFEDGSNSKMYIEINNGKVTVSPHTYEEKDFRISLSFANAVAFVDGKLTLKSLIESKDFYAEGNVVSAIKLASVF